MEIRAGMYSSTSNSPKRSGSPSFSSSITTATLSSAAASLGGSESRARRTCASKEATSVRRPQRAALSDQEDGQQSEGKAADVGEDGHAPLLLRMHQTEAALPDLKADPDAEEPDRRDLA